MNDRVVPNTYSARTASVLNVLAGIWLIVSPFVLGFTHLRVAMWDTLIVGIIVLVLAWARAAKPLRNIGLTWVNVLLGIWLIISPFVLAYGTLVRPTWNDIIFGALVVILAIWSAAATPAMTQPVRR